MYQPRTYRHWIRDRDLVSCNVVVRETDLHIRAVTNLERKARRIVVKYRRMLEGYIERHPTFLTALEPVPVGEEAPAIIREMAGAAEKAGVGPMAAVAGAMAEAVGRELLAFSPEVIVENGGDLYIKCARTRVIGIYAGTSPLSGKLGLEINEAETPLGICTSSGTVGHSLSFGQADAAVVLSPSAALADAAATAIGNLITTAADIPEGINHARNIEGIIGVLIIKDGQMGIWGRIKVTPLSNPVTT